MGRDIAITYMYSKVALATLRTEFTRFQDGGYSAVHLTLLGLSTLYPNFCVLCVPGVVCGSICMQGGP